MKRITLFLLLALTGCASLPLLEIGKNIAEEKHYYYDIDTKLAYSVDRDDDNLYISLKTDNETTIQSLFRQGLYVYLDPNGHKSKDIYFNYPLTGKMGRPGGGGSGRPGMMLQGQIQSDQKQEFVRPALDVNDLIDNSDMEAIFSYHDIAEKMPVYSQKTDIKVTLSSPEEGAFVYELRIPFDRLEKETVSKLTIGIETGELEMPGMGGPGGPGGDMQGGGGMPSGGMQGGAPGGNMGGGSGGMPGGPGGGMQRGPGAGMEDISIWFVIDLDSQTED